MARHDGGFEAHPLLQTARWHQAGVEVVVEAQLQLLEPRHLVHDRGFTG